MAIPSRLSALLILFVFAAIPRAGLGGPIKNGFDLAGSLLSVGDLRSGGPPRDGIPALNQPGFIQAGFVDYLRPEDRVLGLEIGGVAKAYPIRILDWHEIVNDPFGTEPVVVTYCPLCGTGMAFSAVVGGRARTFGVSGLLYNNDVLLFDRESDSLWSQIMSQAVTGPAVGERLELLPLRATTWRDWQNTHPDTLVLAIPVGYGRDYFGEAYPGYAKSASIIFPLTERRDRRYHPKERVLGVEIDGSFKAYPFVELGETDGRVQDEVNGERIEVFFDADNASAIVRDASGREIPSVVGYWFAWTAFHPDTELFTE